MDVALHQVAERREHQALALDPALAGEGGGDDREPEVALTLRSRARMAGVACGLVGQIEPARRERVVNRSRMAWATRMAAP